MRDLNALQKLGWSHFFQQQISLDEYEHSVIARVFEVHRGTVLVVDDQYGQQVIPITPVMAHNLAVGDWLMLTSDLIYIKTLERKSIFKRRSAGTESHEQLIVANLDHVFIVSSLDNNFNLNRLERYIALALDAQVEPVIVLTRRDIAIDVDEKIAAVQSLDSGLNVVALNALDAEQCAQLRPWLSEGKSVACLGSSGVGKSTLINTLLGGGLLPTGEKRQSDSRGRHTTTARSFHVLPSGGLIADTPGMRELQLGDCDVGLALTFDDVEQLARSCRFSDCQHQNEPGCAVANAVMTGSLDPRRLTNYLKLKREQQYFSSSLAERHRQSKKQGKLYKSIQNSARKSKDIW